jgi:hypothetical protein
VVVVRLMLVFVVSFIFIVGENMTPLPLPRAHLPRYPIFEAYKY